MSLSAASVQSSSPPSTPAAPAASLWNGKGFGFTDVLDALNPLQHIPVVNTIYRAVTGDTIGNAARVAGDTLYGGPVGLVIGMVDVQMVESTGSDMGQHVLAMITGTDSTTPAAQSPATPAPAIPQAVLSAIAGAPMAAPPPGPGAIAQPPRPVVSPVALKPAVTAPPSPPAPSPTVKPLAAAAPQGYAIDTSPQGIMALRAASAAHNPAPIPLSIPPGTLMSRPAQTSSAQTSPAPADPTQADPTRADPSQPAAPPPTNPEDFAKRMQQGLEKYAQLMANRRNDPTPGVNEQH